MGMGVLSFLVALFPILNITGMWSGSILFSILKSIIISNEASAPPAGLCVESVAKLHLTVVLCSPEWWYSYILLHFFSLGPWGLGGSSCLESNLLRHPGYAHAYMFSYFVKLTVGFVH